MTNIDEKIDEEVYDDEDVDNDENDMVEEKPVKAKRKRMTNAEKEQLRKQIVDELNEHYPQSVRHVYYRMTSSALPYPIPKTKSGYNKVYNQVKQMRREEIIPFSKIVDPSRSVMRYSGGHTSPASFSNNIELRYYKDMWVDSELHVKVWAESLSIAGVIKDVCCKYDVDLFPSKGFCSDTFIYEAAQKLERLIYLGKQVFIFYVGDFDAAGRIIDLDIKGKLANHILGRGWVKLDKKEAYKELNDLMFVRLAINEDQIEKYDLPFIRKASYMNKKKIITCVEAEALPVDVITSLVEKSLSGSTPERGKLLKAQRLERREIVKALRPLNRPCDYEDGKYIYDDDGKYIYGDDEQLI